MRLSRRTWIATALILVFLAISWTACGFFVYLIPLSSPENLTVVEEVNFQITRGFCLGPAFAMLFLAYVLFRTARRREAAAGWQDLVAMPWIGLTSALGVTLGIVPTLIGLTMLVEPGAGDPSMTRGVFMVFFVIPGLFLIAISALAWFFFSRMKDEVGPETRD